MCVSERVKLSGALYPRGGNPEIYLLDVRQHLCVVGLVSGGLPVPGK